MKKQENAKLSQFKSFAKIWNSHRDFPSTYDLERVLGLSFKSILRLASSYRKFHAENPDFGLPELIWRKAVTGGIIPVPESVIRQLDSFRFDTSSLKGKKGIIVTSAQFGASLNDAFWSSLKIYSEYRDFPLLVLPIKYGPIKTKHGKLTSMFPLELKEHMVFEDLSLCHGNLKLNTVRMRPTLERFLTDRICEMGAHASQIMAAPKLELEHRPRIGRRYAKAVMTTGACTIPNYSLDNLGQQDRTGEVATEEHTYSAIVVEFDGSVFHFRQLLANKRGEFYDICPKQGGAMFFSPRGVEHCPDDVVGVICGDWHTQKTDVSVRRATFGKDSITRLLNPSHVVLHDFVDCDSVSHWEEHQGHRRAYKGPKQWDSLEEELNQAVRELEWMQKQTSATLNVVASNHNEYVTEYIENLKWVRDNRNLEIGARLFIAMVDDLKKKSPKKHEASGIDPVVWWFRTHAPFAKSFERQDVLLIEGILCSMHGDIGVRGAPTRGMKEFRKLNQRVILGHNHSATILGPVWRVGTSTPLKQFYVKNPSTNWTNTHSVIFKNGQRQLLNIIYGKWHGGGL